MRMLKVAVALAGIAVPGIVCAADMGDPQRGLVYAKGLLRMSCCRGGRGIAQYKGTELRCRRRLAGDDRARARRVAAELGSCDDA